MTERKKDYFFPNNLESLSPRELNRQFRRLYQTIPYNLVEEVSGEIGEAAKEKDVEGVVNRLAAPLENIVGNQFRRAESETAGLFDLRLRRLLKLSPTTREFKLYVWDNLGAAFLVGMSLEPTKQRERWILDEEFPDSGGIFVPQRAKEMERIAYNKYLDDCIRGEGVFADDYKKLAAILGTEIDDRQRLGDWRQHYIEKYNDEP